MSGQKGRSGRPKKPTSVRSRRGDYQTLPAEKLSPGYPLPPEDLRDDVQQEWNRLAPLLAEAGVLTKADWVAWEMGMRVYSLWRNAIEELETTPAIEMTDKGTYYTHPLVWVEKSYSERVMKFCRDFGLTPNSRRGLQVVSQSENKPKDPLREMLRRGV